MVSIIIPAYNSAEYIGETIDSVLRQTYRDFEILVIDDGSTDNTKTIITEHYPQVNYLYVPHKGVSAARNYGIGKAQGSYIAFLDADDKWQPNKLALQIECFEHDAALGMVFTEHVLFNKEGIKSTKLLKRKRLMNGDIVKKIFLNSYVTTSTVMVKTEVFSKVGLFETKLTIGEDDNMWLRIASNYQVELLDDPLVLYRVTEGSLTNKGHFYRKVYKSIRILEDKYPALSKRIGKNLFRLKYAFIFFNEGYHFFSEQNYAKANKFYLQSYLYNPFNVRCFLLFGLTLLPSSWINKLLFLK